MTTKQHGGRRPGTGRAVADIQLTQDAAQQLRLLFAAWGRPYSKAAVDAWCCETIAALAAEHDAAMTEAVETALDGECAPKE